mmetsp:Transcript_82979/g.130881  ORF Transcript_82979/g.130881 Transcript_82979/m.130881 type:complete len:768 (+) Transcript_82979:69-2372(+)|eukprot:CAMPEP_0169109390 /NCGR_PEP_ID=MMETSP1015-20121227/25940_1 /TAXON_ID=342587 /ORGANISM="Karlodinium micrum, Strain CCMP2283" /LENGTH=767 /DNA_ID=CAMNT_0009171085 /DNA_START=69 /DNA_END=2372 /DNA_ORIENTATION=+
MVAPAIASALVAVAGVLVMALSSLTWLGLIVLSCACIPLLLSGCKSIGKDEQLRVEGMTDTYVVNGPKIMFLPPFSYRSAGVVKATSLGTADYVKIKDTVGGEERIEKGPQLLFLNAYDQIVKKDTAITLSKTEYLVIEDQLTGNSKTVKGPQVWFPQPHDTWDRKRTAITLQEDEYVRLTDTSTGEKEVRKGKDLIFLEPTQKSDGGVRKVMTLKANEFVRLMNTISGEIKVERGEKTVVPGPHDDLLDGDKLAAIELRIAEYIYVENLSDGKVTTVKGPQVWYPGPQDKWSKKQAAHTLQDDEYIVMKDSASGTKEVFKGKAVVFPEPTQTVEGGIRKAVTLQANEYVRLLDTVSGKTTVHQGEKTVFPGAYEEFLDGEKMAAIELLINEYVKIMNQATGEIKVERGRKLVFLDADDRILDGGKKKAVQVDDEHAVLVRDNETGQLELVKDNQLFVPGANKTIEGIRELVMLADHEAIIVKDAGGNLRFHYGDPKKTTADAPRSFFLAPHEEVLKLNWSGGPRREKKDLYIDRFDVRPQFMWNEIMCRTRDNVELKLEVTLFYQVEDLATMVRKTGNLTGDIYNHLRSKFIKEVALKSLKDFMESMHTVSQAIFASDSEFYTERGVKANSLEVTKYACTEARTSEVLQQIIEETTNRLNRLSQAESENEVNIYKMQGQVEQEKQKGKLLEITTQHAKTEATSSGEAEAERVSAFIKGLEATVPRIEDRILMWQTLRKTDALQVVSAGGANLYYTPNDVNLSIKTD